MREIRHWLLHSSIPNPEFRFIIHVIFELLKIEFVSSKLICKLLFRGVGTKLMGLKWSDSWEFQISRHPGMNEQLLHFSVVQKTHHLEQICRMIYFSVEDRISAIDLKWKKEGIPSSAWRMRFYDHLEDFMFIYHPRFSLHYPLSLIFHYIKSFIVDKEDGCLLDYIYS